MSKLIYQVIQFSITLKFSFIWPIDRTLSGTTTPIQSGPGSNGNEGMLCIPQSSSFTGTLPSDGVVLYLGHSLDRVLPIYKDSVGVFYSPSWLCVCVYVCVDRDIEWTQIWFGLV